MLLTNYIFAISATLAYTDYFPNTDEVLKKFEKVEKIKEVSDIKDTKKITSADEIQVFSLAVHGGKIEKSTEVLSKMLYDRVIGTRKKSALYSFLSDISTLESGNYYNGRCIPTHCCKAIRINDKVVNNMSNFGDGSTCKNFDVEKKFKGKLKEKEECKIKEVCYLNAGHVTSEKFRTKKLNESLPDRYPVSFHGFQDKKDSPVSVVLGGLSKQKYELAKEYHKLTKGEIKIAICRSGNNCRVYDPKNKSFEQGTPLDASGLSGSHENNFVNLGKHKCGLQFELSTTFREYIRNDRARYWDSLVESIYKTLPKKKQGESEEKEKERICDDKRLYGKASIDTEE